MFFKILLVFILSLVVTLIITPFLISYLKSISFNQSVNEYALKEYKEKEKTPIMGGIVFVLVPVILTTLFDIKGALSGSMPIVLMTFVGYGLIGFIDDYLIVIKNNNDGLSPLEKFLMQLALALLFYVIYSNNKDLTLSIPIINKSVDIGIWYALLIFFMFTGSSNAVNITDGMDGLSSGCMIIALIPFFIFSLIDKNYILALFIVALVASLLGYLYFNKSPAKIYMGDTGSLALGAVLAAIAMVLKKEILLIIIGGVFVWETLCVIIQISSVKLFKRRVFKYTPIHYSFILNGMRETSVVKSFWLLGAIFAFIGLLIGLI